MKWLSSSQLCVQFLKYYAHQIRLKFRGGVDKLTSLLEPRHPDYAEEVISFLKFSELFIIDFIVRISCTSSLSSVTFFATCVVSRTTQSLQGSSHPGHNNINDILETACRALFYLTAESPSDVFKEDVDVFVDFPWTPTASSIPGPPYPQQRRKDSSRHLPGSVIYHF